MHVNGSLHTRLRRLERMVQPRRSVALFQDLDDGTVFRDAAGAVYVRDGPGVIRDGAGEEVTGEPLIVVTYGDRPPEGG